MGIRLKNEEERAIYYGERPNATDEDATVTIDCYDCSGKGYIRGYEHVDNGICYRCNGTGDRKTFTVRELREKAVRKYRDRQYALHQKQKAAAPKIAWREENADLIARAEIVEGHKDFQIINEIIWNRWVPSVKQVELVRTIIERHEGWAARKLEEDLTKADCPTGATVVTGNIIAYRLVNSEYGEAVKITVEDETGFRVYGTLPSNLMDALYDEWLITLDEDANTLDYGPEVYLEAAKGRKITFTATLAPSDDDPKFGFYSRPRKASLVQEVAA